MKSLTGPGANYHACREASSASNRDACEIWCNNNRPTCVRCSTHVGCGTGQTAMNSFRGPGDNWFACRRR